MNLKRPSLAPRRVSEPAQIYGVEAPVREQTLRTLEMLKAMGYKEVWCKTDEVDAATIALAAAEGWRVVDAQDARIKFSRAAGVVPASPSERGRPGPWRRPSEQSLRTASPTRVPEEPLPSPLARMRKLSEEARQAAGPQDIIARREARQNSVTWERKGSAGSDGSAERRPSGLSAHSAQDPRRPSTLSQASRLSSTPSLIVSPPHEEGGVCDYFAYVPPDPSPGLRRSSRIRRPSFMARPSERSLSSIDAIAEDLFTFDIADPFDPIQERPESPTPPFEEEIAPDEHYPGTGTQTPVATRTLQAMINAANFRPSTPHLHVGAGRGRGGALAPDALLQRPTYQLGRIASDPGTGATDAPQFDLQPVVTPRWPLLDAYKRSREDGRF